MVEDLDWKFIVVIIILVMILIIIGFLVYINIYEIKNTDRNCLTASDVRNLHSTNFNSIPLNPAPSIPLNLAPTAPVSVPLMPPTPTPTPTPIKYSCQDLIDQYDQLMPYVLWDNQYRNIVVNFLNQRDPAYDIKYLHTLNNHILYILVQSKCADGNMYKAECFGLSDVRNIPYHKWSTKDRNNAIIDAYSIFAIDKKDLDNLNNKTLYDLLKISCSD